MYISNTNSFFPSECLQSSTLQILVLNQYTMYISDIVHRKLDNINYLKQSTYLFYLVLEIFYSQNHFFLDETSPL